MKRKRSEHRSDPPSPASLSTREVAVTGTFCRVTYARRADGSMPAKDYLEKLTIAEQLQFMSLFGNMANTGVVASKTKFRPSIGTTNCGPDGGKPEKFVIAEFKIHSGPGRRILACQYQGEWVLILGFSKGKKLDSQLQTANTIFCEEHRLGDSR